jgi:hypothetical protein
MRLDRANGYFQTFNEKGVRIEGETRQCVHCSFMWIYNPGESFSKKLTGEWKPVTRGKCLQCYGLVCARPECMKNGCKSYLQQIEELENLNRAKGGLLLI